VDNQPYQFYRIAPDGVILVTTSLEIADYSLQAVEDELPLFWKHVEALVHHGIDRIVLTGVPVSAALGRERVRALIEQASQQTGVPVDTDLEAIASAIQHLGVGKVALATRWHEPLNDAVARYLGLAGIEVVGRRASGRTMAENATLGIEEGMDLAIELGRAVLRAAPEAEGLILPGGRWLSIHAVPVLEAEFGKPVFLNLNSSLWAALRDVDLQQPVKGEGMLLASLR
jgi:maleate cis-trans isomerase